ncbi:MAG: DegT/DnrJ/EryC1/StrS family aminotransferase [Chloroflexi bacterium]|nr:DegT/DnrJ/EryC1/StrS family aminotransferase [Chloroflexota bacterium]
MPFVDLKSQSIALKQDVLRRIGRIIDDSSFVSGAEVEEFEQKFAEYCGVNHAVGVANGTDAIMLALRALNIGQGDEVITAANTFVATLEAIVHAGARPVLVDINADTYNIDVDKIESHITPRTKAIIPVHLYGQSADMGPILELARERGMYVIEDAAQAHGAAYRGQTVGSMGTAGCFSFYPAKNLGAFGDGGAVVTSDDEVASSLRALRDHGSSKKYQHEVIGYNSRLDSMQAAVLNVKLDLIDTWNQQRRKSAHTYDEFLAEVPQIVTPVIGEGSTHVYHLYVIRVVEMSRDSLVSELRDRGVQTGIHYPYPVHLTGAFWTLGYPEGSFPIAENHANQIVSLPMYPEITESQIRYVVDQIKYCTQAGVVTGS